MPVTSVWQYTYPSRYRGSYLDRMETRMYPMQSRTTMDEAPSPIDPNLVRIHDVGVYPGLQMPGLAAYAQRALLLPGTAVVHTGVPHDYIDYLKGVGIGAHTVMEVPGEHSLVGGLTYEQILSIRDAVDNGARVELFIATPEQRQMIESFGINYASGVWGPSPEIADKVNSKTWLRGNIEDTYPEHYIVSLKDRNGAQIYGHAARLIAVHNGAVLKPSNLATGEAFTFIPDGDTWIHAVTAGLRLLRDHGIEDDIILEAEYKKHVPLSVQMEIRTAGPQVICATVQQITHGSKHAGNFLSSTPQDGIPEEIIDRALAVGWQLHALGYQGYCGWDSMNTKDGLLSLEINGRVTGAMYPLGVALQAQANGLEHWAVGSENMTTGIRSFGKLSERLGPHLFDGQTGILPACPGLLVTGTAMLYAVGDSVAEAKRLLAEAGTMIKAS